MVHRGEIYGFLGHNGAGKTTTVSMLSGEFPPTGGYVDYNFRDGKIKFDGYQSVSEVQSRVGVCPQHNMLLEELTCKQNLKLFAQLKGNVVMKEGQTKAEAIDVSFQPLLLS